LSATASLTDRLSGALGVEVVQVFGMPVVQVAAVDWLASVRILRDTLGFDMLLDVTAVDWPGRLPRFDVVAHLLSTGMRQRVRVKTGVHEHLPVVDSLLPLYPGAAFLERECHDMFGIQFRGNADLRPILLYEGFVGHPLRKDYDKHREQPLVPYRDS
jgi:NADH-quinone oxidoreductase subunit C